MCACVRVTTVLVILLDHGHHLVQEHGPALGELDLFSRLVIRDQEVTSSLNGRGPDVVVGIIQKIGDFVITLSLLADDIAL